MRLYRINALLLKYWYITINRIDRLFDIFYWPIIDLFIWGFAAYYIEDISQVNLLSMLIGGIILWIFVWRSSQDIAVYVLEDFWSKNLYHLFSSPVTLAEHTISLLILGFLRSIATFGVMVTFAYILYGFNILILPPLLLGAAVLLLSLFGWITGLLITALIFRYGQRIQVLAWSVVFIIQPFACIFYPLSSLPWWAQWIAVLLPPTHVFEALRQSLASQVINYTSLFGSFALNVILFIPVAFFLASSFNKSKETGLLAKGD